MTMTIVHLVRHGEVHNPEGILYGRLPDYHLSERGQQMAQLVAEHFVEEGSDVTYLVASPLERAQETAAPIAAALGGLQVGTEDRVIESANAFEGTKFAVRALRNPKVLWLCRNPARPSWGEPYARIAQRMLAAAATARDAALGHEAVIVSHQLPIWIARLAAEGRKFPHDPRKRQCNLASVTSLHYRGQDLMTVSYSEPASSLYTAASTRQTGA